MKIKKGKTTLLNALTLRNRGNFQIDGDIKCNGTIMKSYEDISSVSGYVQQDDLFIGKSEVQSYFANVYIKICYVLKRVFDC